MPNISIPRTPEGESIVAATVGMMIMEFLFLKWKIRFFADYFFGAHVSVGCSGRQRFSGAEPANSSVARLLCGSGNSNNLWFHFIERARTDDSRVVFFAQETH